MGIKGGVLGLAILAAVLCISGNVFAVLSGDGTQGSPYLIQSRADFDEYANLANAELYWASGVYTKLTCNLDLSGTIFTQAVIASNPTAPYMGTFDGDSHIIYNLTIDASTQNFVALFGAIDTGGQVNNLGVENVTIAGRNNVGGLAGFTYFSTITSCYVTGSVTATGEYSCTVGGLIGESCGSTVANCYANGLISGIGQDIYAGGLVGWNDGWDGNGVLTSCFTTGSVSGIGQYVTVGGLTGRNSGTVTSCYSTGSVNATSPDDYISSVGGLVGSAGGTMAYCYATGAVSGTVPNMGGLTGEGKGALIACFWNIETSGQSVSGGGKGLTTAQMKTLSIYQSAGWADNGWVINNGIDYPRLAWENTSGVPIPQPQPVPLLGSGTEQYPYQIWTVDDFTSLSWHIGILDKYISLMTDLDLSGVKLYPIGVIGTFSGVFDGNNNTIQNAVLDYPGSDYIGLFDTVGIGGQIRNLSVENITVTGRRNIGGLAAMNSGTLSHCCVAGSVSSAYSSIGGLSGSNSGSIIACQTSGTVNSSGAGNCIGGLIGGNSGSLTDCYANSSVNGTDQSNIIGGLAGYNSGTIIACHATGSVNGETFVGGLAGENFEGLITSCYATGSVSGISQVGGLVGVNWSARMPEDSTIINSYATGSVTGTSDRVGGLVGHGELSLITFCYATGSVSSLDSVGGLVGYDIGSTLTACYAMGSVTGNSKVGGLVGKCFPDSITGSFWDMDASGLNDGVGNVDPDPVGVMGKTTTEMMTLLTFTSAGWDFSATDGDAAEWRMLREHEDYPRLAWQAVFAGDVAGLYGVDGDDLMEVVNHWLEQGCSAGCEQADTDGSGTVDLGDYAILAGDWMKGI